MNTWHWSKRLFVVAFLSIAAGNCGNSTPGNSGTGGTTPSGTGGISSQGGATPTGGSAANGGAVSTGGLAMTGGVTTSGGATAGGSIAKSGGSTSTGGVSVSGGSTGSGGVARSGGSMGGGTTATGGTTDAAVPTGGAAGAASGGNRQTGGTVGGSTTGGAPSTGGKLAAGQRPISFGTLLDAQTVMAAAQQLAKSQANPSAPTWQAKGDQHRTYRFAEANNTAPYRLCVPSSWDGKSKLPLAMFLHGSGSNENTYLDSNNKQMITLAEQHGYLLVSPLGDQGAYGNFLRLSAPFGNEKGAADLMAQVTDATERTNELSEKDVINVLELVLNEYPIDRNAMFLMGHSMGSGGTWYIGGKYAGYWKGLAPLSGPFVQKTGYPWEDLRAIYIFVTEGTQTPSLDASRLLRDWLKTNTFLSEYKEVNADHGGMIPLVLPDIFAFFDRVSKL